MSEKRKKEAPPPAGFPGDTETRVSNLMQVAKGASLILTALNDHIGDGEVSQIVTTGAPRHPRGPHGGAALRVAPPAGKSTRAMRPDSCN